MASYRFIDTSALIALLEPKDQYHSCIHEFLAQSSASFWGITSNLVLAELLSFSTRRGSLRSTLQFHEELLKNPELKVVWVDQGLHRAGVQILEKFSNLPLSFTDATSMAIMKRERIVSAITFDSDFRKAGFEMLPGEE